MLLKEPYLPVNERIFGHQVLYSLFLRVSTYKMTQRGEYDQVPKRLHPHAAQSEADERKHTDLIRMEIRNK